MADQGFVGLDDPTLSAPPVAPTSRPNPTDVDLSNVPPPQPLLPRPVEQPGFFSRFFTSKTGPQDLTSKSDVAGAAPTVAEPSAGTGQPAAAGPTTSVQPAVPTAPAYPSWPTPPAPIAPPEEPWLTRTAKSVADAISGIQATSHAIWERDTIFTGLSAAQSDAIADINDKVKATYGVDLPDPTHGGYLDQASKNIRDRVYQGGLSAVGANEPESVFGGGDRYRAAIQKEQFKLWDDARQALFTQHGASEATRDEAASVLQPDTPAAQLGAKYSHAANVAEAQAWERGDFSTRAFMTAAGIGVSATNLRDPMTIPSLMVGGGMEPTLAKALYPLAAPAVRTVSNVVEQGVRQAAVNMGFALAEAPEHQAANLARGEEHGLQPALKDIGTAGLYGFIPGALIGGVKALSRAWGDAARSPVDEFIRQAYGLAPDETLTNLIKSHFDAVHAWEEANGFEKGSSYSDAGLRDRTAWRRGPTEPPAPAGAAPPPEPGPAPRGGPGETVRETPRSAASPEPSPGSPRELAPPLWEGKPYPTPPDIPDASRQRPSPSSITLAAIESAEADHTALPASVPGTPPSEIMRAYKEAIQHAESPDVMAPPEPPMSAGPRPDEGFLKPDHVPAPPARPTAGGDVVKTSGYDGPDPDAVKNRIAHLQAVASAPDTDPRVARELARRARDFTNYIQERDARMTAVGLPEDQARAIRALRPGDVVTAENTHGDRVTGEIGGWGHDGIPQVSDSEGIHHNILPETITNIRRGIRENAQAQGAAPAGTVVIDHNGKPYTEGVRFDPRQLKTDALTYQYKGGADVSGVTERLRTVKRWSPMSAGNIVVHERLDGNQYVADGHQRTGLANRIMDADPTQKIVQPGMLLREADGWTPQEVRAEAAAKNIREGLGDTIDIARILRDAPDMWDDSLPVGRGDLKEARGLANLSDAAWEMALNNIVPHNYASLVGNMVSDKDMHVAIMDDLARIEPRTPNQARFVISDAMQAGFHTESQIDLFGTNEITRSLSMERSQVYDEASRLLRSDAKLFSMLDAQAGRIEEAGNILVDTNADQATRAGQLAQALGTLAERAGPTSAALNRAAQTVADGVKLKTAARAFLTELPALLQQEGLKIPDTAAPPAYDVDTPQGRAEQTQDLEAEFMAAQPGLFGAPPTRDSSPASILADIPGALQTGSIDAKRFSSAPTTEQLDEIIERGNAYNNAETDQLFGEDAPVVKKLMKRDPKNKLDDLVDEKYGRDSPQADFLFGTNGAHIINDESLRELRDTISNVEAEVDAAAQGDATKLPRELSWLARKLPDIAKDANAHSEPERIAVLGLARALEDMQAKGIDPQPVLRAMVAYTGAQVHGDAEDTHLLLEKIAPYVKQFAGPAQAEPSMPFTSSENKLSLRQVSEPNVNPVTGREERTLNIDDEYGRDHGVVNVSYDPGTKNIEIVSMEARNLENGLSRENATALLSNLQTVYPDADTVSGLRITGTRTETRTGTKIPLPGRPNRASAQIATPLMTSDPLVDHVTADPYVASAIADPIINRKNDVPYGAGPNKANDRVVNVDRHVPKTDTIGGVKYEPAHAVAVHEQVEKHVLDQLTAAGVPESEAYEVAHFVFAEPAERAWVEANVGPKAWDKYQAHWDKWLKPIDHENPKNPPPDLYEKPYPHDDDHLAPEDRGSDKTFEETGHRNLPELRATAERVLGDRALQGATAEGRIGDLESTVRGVAHEAAVAAAASPDALDRQIGQILEREVAPLIDEAFPPATEAGPEGTQQTLMPGVAPVTGADRARLGAAAPLRGGNAPPPEGGLFDEAGRAQHDLFDELARAERELDDLIPTEDGLISSHDLQTKVPLETMLAKLVSDCGRA